MRQYCYVKMLSYANILILDIYGQHLKDSELHKYHISMWTNFLSKC